MKRAWQGASLFFLILSIFVLIHSFQYPYSDKLGPGPGFFSVWLAIVTGGLSVALLLQSSLSKDLFTDAPDLIPERSAIVRILIILVALVGVLVLLNPLGFRICILVFLLVLPTALGARSWLAVLVLAFAGSFGIFHVFYYWLKLPLPIGVFGI